MMHEILVLLAYVLKPQCCISDSARGVIFCLRLHLLPYICMVAAKTLASPLICAGLSAPSLVHYAKSTKTSCACSATVETI